MKKCLLYGNCQPKAVETLLKLNPEFASSYETVHIECFFIHISDIPHLERLASEADLFIYQPVSDNYRGINQLSSNHLISLLKPGSRAISIPVSYFTGYNPEMVYIKTDVQAPFIVHDRNILISYFQGKNVQETIELIQSNDFYQEFYVKNNVEVTLAELRRREAEIDIKIADFVEGNYKKARLFHTINHPTSIVVAHIANSILNLLGIQSERDSLAHFYRVEVLDELSFPIYPSVARHLELSFPCDSQYRYVDFFSINSAVERLFNFYDSYSEVVDPGIIETTGVYSNELASEKDIEYCYRLLLGREPDSQGKVYWSNRIIGEAVSNKYLVLEFLNSFEFQAKYQNASYQLDLEIDSISQCIDFCYNLLLHREPNQDERNYWEKQVREKSLSEKDLVLKFLESQGFIMNAQTANSNELQEVV